MTELTLASIIIVLISLLLILILISIVVIQEHQISNLNTRINRLIVQEFPEHNSDENRYKRFKELCKYIVKNGEECTELYTLATKCVEKYKAKLSTDTIKKLDAELVTEAIERNKKD